MTEQYTNTIVTTVAAPLNEGHQYKLIDCNNDNQIDVINDQVELWNGDLFVDTIDVDSFLRTFGLDPNQPYDTGTLAQTLSKTNEIAEIVTNIFFKPVIAIANASHYVRVTANQTKMTQEEAQAQIDAAKAEIQAFLDLPNNDEKALSALQNTEIDFRNGRPPIILYNYNDCVSKIDKVITAAITRAPLELTGLDELMEKYIQYRGEVEQVQQNVLLHIKDMTQSEQIWVRSKVWECGGRPSICIDKNAMLIKGPYTSIGNVRRFMQNEIPFFPSVSDEKYEHFLQQYDEYDHKASAISRLASNVSDFRKDFPKYSATLDNQRNNDVYWHSSSIPPYDQAIRYLSQDYLRHGVTIFCDKSGLFDGCDSEWTGIKFGPVLNDRDEDFSALVAQK